MPPSERHRCRRRARACAARGWRVQYLDAPRAGALNEAQRPIYAQCFEAPRTAGTDAPAGWRLTPAQARSASAPIPAAASPCPQGFYDKLIDAEKAYGGMIDAAFVFDTASGNALPIPTDNDTTNSGAILGENVRSERRTSRSAPSP
jgi:hypothetical protein